MKSRILLLLVLVCAFVVGGAAAQDSSLSYDGISFTVPDGLATTLTIQNLPANPIEETPEGPQPAFTLFTLTTGTGDDERQTATITVYAIGEAAAYPRVQEQIAALTDILANRPSMSEFGGTNALPYLPIMPAVQVVRARADYADLAGINGISYVTAYAQDVSPFMSSSFRYTFQGITADGAAYVSAVFPLNTDLFPAMLPADFDFTAFDADFENYITTSVETLNTATADDFSPSLTALDALIGSITIDTAGLPIVDATAPEAVPTPDPNIDPTLGGLAGDWTLTAYGPIGALVIPLAEAPVTLNFRPEGVSGSDGCNSYSGSFQYENDILTFGMLVSTMMACADPIMAQAAVYGALLGTVTNFVVEGDMLRLISPVGELAFTRTA